MYVCDDDQMMQREIDSLYLPERTSADSHCDRSQRAAEDQRLLRAQTPIDGPAPETAESPIENGSDR